MRVHSILSGFSISRSRVFIGSLAVACTLVCFTVIFLYMGQIRMVRRSEDVFVERLNQTAGEYLAFIRGGFAQSSELVQMVRERNSTALWRKFEEFRKGYAGAELLLTEKGKVVFLAGDLRESGPGLRGRIARGGRLQAGATAVLYDDFGRAVPDIKASFWLDLSGAMVHLESLAEGASFSPMPRPGAIPVFPGVWLLRSPVSHVLLSILKTPAYLGLLLLQGVVVFFAVLLGAMMFHQRESLYHRIISLSGILEEKDPYTMGHSDRVAFFAVRIGAGMGLGQKRLERLKIASLAHDLGKIFVPIEVLNSPGMLNEEEWRVIKRHPIDSERIFRKLLSGRYEARAIRSHHERWDGRGYPDGLAGEAIPIGARIIAVADTFDAMTSRRPYREALPVDEALRIIRKNAGTQFDPEIAGKALETLAQAYEEIQRSALQGNPLEGKDVPVVEGAASEI